MSTTGSTKDRTPAPDPDTPATPFLAWLEGTRASRDISWAEVSRRSGISENGLRRIRQAEVTPRPATITALAKALDADADEVAAVEQAVGTLLPFGRQNDEDALHPIPARRSAGEATTWLTVGVASPRAQRLDRDTAGRLILFLEASARAWLATTDCTESD